MMMVTATMIIMMTERNIRAHFDGRHPYLLLAKSTTVAIDLCALVVGVQSVVVCLSSSLLLSSSSWSLYYYYYYLSPYLAQLKAQIYCALSILSRKPTNLLTKFIYYFVSNQFFLSFFQSFSYFSVVDVIVVQLDVTCSAIAAKPFSLHERAHR